MLGNVSVDGDVGEDVVAVLGNVELGTRTPHIHGQVVSVLGVVTQDPAAVVDGSVQRIPARAFHRLAGHPHLGGSWADDGSSAGIRDTACTGCGGLSLTLLAFYVILNLLFRDAAETCIATLNEHPGESLVTAILAVMLTPLMLLLLVITVVGIPIIPIFLIALFLAGVFGKATVLGWIGGRCLGMRAGHAAVHPALATLVGGLIVMLGYMIPVLGFMLFIVLSMIGYGAVLYTLLNRFRQRRANGTVPPGPAPSGTAPPGTPGFAPSAAADATAEDSCSPRGLQPRSKRPPRTSRRFPGPRCRAPGSGRGWAPCSLMQSS